MGKSCSKEKVKWVVLKGKKKNEEWRIHEKREEKSMRKKKLSGAATYVLIDIVCRNGYLYVLKSKVL